MKRCLFLLPAAVLAIFVPVACENLVTDLPETDINQYISGNTVIFPKGTKAIDIYNTIVHLYSDNEYHAVTNGNWKYIKTTNTDGLINQTWESLPFTKIKHTHTKRGSEINTHTVYLYSSDTSVKEIVFEWQRQTTNVLKNNAIEGDITFVMAETNLITGTPPVLENVTFDLKGYVPPPGAIFPPGFSDGDIIEIHFVVKDPDLDAKKLIIHYEKLEEVAYNLLPQTQELQEYTIDVPYVDVYTSGSSYITIVDGQGNISNRCTYLTDGRSR